MIRTARLRLVPATQEQIRALIRGDAAGASRLVGATVPNGWPEDAEARQGLPWHLAAIEKDPIQRLWRIRFVVEQETNAVIGSVNMKGPPANGDVEIGWGIVPDKRRRGFATEASQAVIDWALGFDEVRRVTATIPDENTSSQRVAQRLGMIKTAEMRRGLPVWAIEWR